VIGLDLRRSVWSDCGILACGFAHAYCDTCGHDFLVAFSCKGRGLCPSCTTRRMAEAAAHLVEHVFPQVPVRQWVVTFPRRLRFFLHRDPVLLGRVRRRCPLRGLEVGAAAGGLTPDAASFGMTATGKSIFLSYASQDVDAARRICAAATPSQRDPDRRT
jgi:hypothetical protein